MNFFSKPFLVRCAVIIFAMFFTGLGVSLMRISCMGTDPFSSVNYAISEFCDIPLGLVVMLVSAILLIFCILFMRKAIGFGMIANMMLLGTSADFWRNILLSAFPHFTLLPDSVCLPMTHWGLSSKN